MKSFILLCLALLLTGCTHPRGVSLEDTNIAQVLCNPHGTLDTFTGQVDITGEFIEMTCQDGSEIMYRPPPTKGRF